MALHWIFSALSLGATAGCYIARPTLSLWWLPALLPGFYVGAVILYLLAVLVIPALFLKKTESPTFKPIYRPIAYYTLDWLMGAMGFRVKAVGADSLPAEPYLLVCNHRHAYDPLITIAALKNRHFLTFVAKPEVMAVPVLGRIMWHASFLPIDRENPRRAVETIRRAATYITERGLSIGIYPEGTRNKGEGLLPFHNGVFKIAKTAACPVAVCTLRYTGRRVTLTVEAVLDKDFVAQNSNAAIGDQAREIMETALAQGKE